MRMKSTQKHEMYMANVSPNARGANATYISLARFGLALGPWGFALGLRGFSETNMLVLATRTSHIGGHTQRPNTRGFVLQRNNIGLNVLALWGR